MRTLANYKANPWSAFNGDLFGFLDDFTQPLAVTRRERSEFPRCDVEETDKAFLMSFDLPGVKKENLNIEVKDGVMTLTGERKSETKKEGYSERFYGTFQRNFSLPDHVDAEKIEAHYENGVLQVALPKAEAKTGKKIEIGEKNKGLFSKLIGNVKKEESAA